MRAVQFRVTGRVQGVGFRAFAVRAAQASGVSGEVWNTRDGAVEGRAEGEAVQAFLDALARGPGHVDSVTWFDVQPLLADKFEIGPTR